MTALVLECRDLDDGERAVGRRRAGDPVRRWQRRRADGGDGIDTLNAGTDADRLDGCAGNDTLNGDPGDDVLIGAPRGRLQCNMLTLHAAGSRNRRRAFSVRLVGDDLRLAEHPLFPRL